MNQHHSLNYIEIACRDLVASKLFFGAVFNWVFSDYFDPESGAINYSAFSLDNINGGFFSADKVTSQNNGGALIVFYSQNLNLTETEIKRAGGVISKPTFNFPGGRRFHFSDPSGNEFAVWSDQ
jgi:predicted enzyme related to lactoylglutathione lyase|tara:strand:- start:10962 stop:11333 length:372 start_codon:yes stop_codon:yes gene_type:complete